MKEEKHFPFRGQQYPVKSTMMLAGLSLYDHKYDKEISGNEGSKVMRGIEHNGIMIFDSFSSDIGDICVYPIPESYPGIVKAIDSIIVYLYYYYPNNKHREPKEPCLCDVSKFAKSVF